MSSSSDKQKKMADDELWEKCKKLSKELDKKWHSTKPYMGHCGNCQKYAMLMPQDAGMFCSDC